MNKEQVITRICESGLVAVIRAEKKDQAKRITEACVLQGGLLRLK